MRTVHHTIQMSRTQTRTPLKGWHAIAAKSDTGVVSVFTARKINPCGDPGGLLKERQQ